MGVIDRIIVDNFKSLRHVDLSLGRMNLFIGANASGKSNFLDALRVLQGVGNGFTIGEILDGKPKSATSAVWDGIRGGSPKACFAEAGDSDNPPEQLRGAVTIETHGTLESGSSRTWELLIAFSPSAGRVTRERFKVESAIYDSDEAIDSLPNSPRFEVRCYNDAGLSLDASFENARPVLGQVALGYFAQFGHANAVPGTDELMVHIRVAGQVAARLANAQRIDPELRTLRNYSQSVQARRMGERGENFAALIKTVCQDDTTKDAYLSWLQELRPEEVNDVGVLSGAVGEPLFVLREGGREFPAPVLSNGTLRFAALAAAFFQPDMPSLMTIEEIENGIHATRVHLLLELLRGQAEAANTQVVATTHSATILDWLREEEYRTTFFCKRDEETGESRICALADVPRFLDVVKTKPASELFSEGWLEAAL